MCASVSEAVGSGEVLASIGMFGFAYLLLGALWIYVLDRKIKHGPDPAPVRKPGQGLGGLAAAAADYRHEGKSGPAEA